LEGYGILVIEEDTTGLNCIDVSALSAAGFRMTSCSDPLAAFSKLVEMKPHLIVLGEGLSPDSFEICRRLRWVVNVPIIMLGSISRCDGWSRSVKSGADCYMPQPAGCWELVARIRAMLRRCEWYKGEAR